jgi:hypothetical protein
LRAADLRGIHGRNARGNRPPMASETPQHRLESTFRRWHATVRRQSLLTGAGWCIGAGIGLLLLIGLADWKLHLDDVRLRAGLVITAAVVWGLLLIGRVIVPAVRRMRAVETARQIEKSRPHWRGALISSVEFATGGCRSDEGAPALQESVIARAAAQLTEQDLQPLVRRRALRQSACFAASMTIVAGVLVIADPSNALLALSRMIAPGTSPSWPRRHTLVLLDSAFHPIDPLQPMRPTALGERLTIYIDDPVAGLPEQTTLQITESTGERQSLPIERTVISDGTGRRREIGVASLRSGSPQLRVRATGGDDDRMPWHTFEFAPRPSVKQYKLQLTPPEYTGQPPQEIVATGGDIAALVGTRVQLEAEFDRPVREAAFQQSGLPPSSQQLSTDHRRFTVTFPIPAAAGGTYSIDLVGSDALPSADAPWFRVEGIADREPTIALTQPAGDLTITPQAVIPVRVEARDDLGLVYVRLVSAEPPGSAGEQVQPLPLAVPLLREAQIDTQIAPGMIGLEPGRALIVRAEATDAYNLDGQHVVRSVARTLSVVTPEEKQRELSSRQAGIAELLERSAELQTQALQQTRALQLQWQTAAQFSATDFDSLRRLAHDQAQIAAALHDSQHGGSSQARQILEEFAWNGLADAATQDRLVRLESELGRLKEEIAPEVDRAVAEAFRRVSAADQTPTGEVVEALAAVEQTQSTVNDILTELAAQFSEWRRHHDLTRSLAEIVLEQSQITRETRETGRRTLTTPLTALPADDRARLARLGQRQERAAESLTRFQERLQRKETIPDATTDSEALPEPDVQQALKLLADDDVVNDMQLAAQLVARNAIAESAEAQQDIAQTLEKLEEAIRGLDSPTPEALIQRVERALEEAETLHERQAQLETDTRQSADLLTGVPEIAYLREQQQQLSEDAGTWAQRLRRQQLREAAGSAAQAAAEMGAAAAQLAPDELTGAVEHQQAAREQLFQTVRGLQAARKALEFDHTISELSRVASLVDGFAARQAQLIEEAARLSGEQGRKSGLSRAQLRSLLALADAQQQLAADVDEVGNAAESTAIIREALAPAVEQMRIAAERLGRRRLDDDARQSQQAALDELHALLNDLQVTERSPTDPRGANSDDQPPMPSNWPLATQLKVLLRLQTGIAQRVGAIRSAAQPGGTPSDEQRQDLQELADQQSRLAELLQQLLSNAGQQEQAL